MKKYLYSFLLSFVIIVATIIPVSLISFAETQNGESVIVFTADVHNMSSEDASSANRLKRFLEAVTTDYGPVDTLGICGDLAIYTVYGDKYWKYAQRVIDNSSSLVKTPIYTTGNHEHANGSFSSTSNKTAKKYIRLGVGESDDNYSVYCFGAASSTMEFTESDIAALSAYLESVGTDKTVFILSHFPLHVSNYTRDGEYKTRDAINREKIIDLLNHYPNAYFVWGHNHSHNDSHYGAVNTDNIDGKDISFTYIAAGCMSEESDGNKYAGKIEEKGLLAIVSKDGKTVSLTYLGNDFKPVSNTWKNTGCAKYAVSFDANGGIGTMKDVFVKADNDGNYNYTAPETCDFKAPKGMRFAGWSDSIGGEAKKTFTIAHNTTLYPVWKEACITDKTVALQDGSMHFVLNGYELGVFTFKKSSSGWTIMDDTGKYIGISSKALSRSTTAYNWTYSNGVFSAKVQSGGWFGSTNTYYLTAINGKLAISNSNSNNAASFYIHIERVNHSYTQNVTAPTCQNEGYTTYTCSCGATYTDTPTEKTDHIFMSGHCTMCGAKDPSVTTVCEGYKAVSLKEATLKLSIGGVDLGTYTFAKSGNSWTIMDDTGKYIGISSKVLSRSTTAYNWTYSNGVFSAKVQSGGWFGSKNTYYLTASNRVLAISTTNNNNVVTLSTYVENSEHSFGAWTADISGSHSRTCSICGEKQSGSCNYGTDHKCTVCGTNDPTYQPPVIKSINVQVGLTSSKSGLIFRKTTYKATITPSAEGTTVSKVQYSTNNSTWTTGTAYSSSSKIEKLYIKITDKQGDVYTFLYNNGKVTAL